MKDEEIVKNDSSYDVKTDINEDKSNIINKNERSNLEESDQGNLIPVADKHSAKKKGKDKNVDFTEDQAPKMGQIFLSRFRSNK